jgi:HD-GYP domain-containing protein (c-di-GMP phosphodiesterase class II)/DNA-binding CsgD family transcriptional regulator
MSERTASPRLRLAEVVAVLSLATDLGMSQPMDCGLRSCLLAVRLGEALGLGEAELGDVYYLALLRFVGCTANAHTIGAVFGDELAARAWMAPVDYGRPVEVLAALVRNVGAGQPPLRRARTLVSALAGMPRLMETGAAHCEVAQRLAGRLGFGPGIAGALGQVFEHWDGRGLPRGLKGEQIARSARVVAFAHDAALFHRIGGPEAAVGMARERSGNVHDPAVVEAFRREAGRLLASLDTPSVWDAVLAAEPGAQPWLARPQVETAARAIADFVDLKSPFTGGHSSGVAALAAAAATGCGLPAEEVDGLRLTGLLHDLGRVAVSADVWDKPAPLSDGEWEQVRLHPYHAERILARAPALSPFGQLAALHHERLDGSGYHRGAPASLQPLAARLLAAADAYQAMTEPRPHRPARPAEAAADELRREVRAGRLDGDAANAVLSAAGHRVRPGHRTWPAGLSDREVEVLRLVARGLSNRQMAARLSLSDRTVQHHVEHIYDKIDVSTRAAATLFAMQHDLLGADAPVGK